MKSKNFLLIFIIIICLPFLLSSCSNQKRIKPDTPVNTAIIVTENFLKVGNYQNFNELFTDGRKSSVSVEQFNELKKLTTAGMNLKHYELLTFTNGKMILIKLTPERVDGEYKIEDVIEVPDEMKSLFK
jgi:hypothetical protein